MILGGDMTGKALVPVVHEGGDAWHGTIQEQRHQLNGEDEVAALEQNVTPWQTDRELPEDQLLERINGIAAEITIPPERVILNLHCPPYASGLDDAPGLNEDLTPKHGGHAPEPVGSTAVRRAIEQLHP